LHLEPNFVMDVLCMLRFHFDIDLTSVISEPLSTSGRLLSQLNFCDLKVVFNNFKFWWNRCFEPGVAKSGIDLPRLHLRLRWIESLQTQRDRRAAKGRRVCILILGNSCQRNRYTAGEDCSGILRSQTFLVVVLYVLIAMWSTINILVTMETVLSFSTEVRGVRC